MFYLFCLPPALHLSGLDGIMTTVLSMVVGYAMFGLDEIDKKQLQGGTIMNEKEECKDSERRLLPADDDKFLVLGGWRPYINLTEIDMFSVETKTLSTLDQFMDKFYNPAK